jgi:hypothetical protein
MITKLFDTDPMTAKVELFHYDETNDSFTIETQQDVTDLVEDNKYEFNLHDGMNSRWKGDLHRVAQIPLSVYYDLKRRGMLPEQDAKAFSRWMNDPDNRVFRTRPGRV